jgi:predicted RNA binding protein YcfA (HicA-like mRNA interferase family)
VRELEKQGFSVKRTGSGHWMVRPPEGREGCVVLAFSPKLAVMHKSITRLKNLGYNPRG